MPKQEEPTSKSQKRSFLFELLFVYAFVIAVAFVLSFAEQFISNVLTSSPQQTMNWLVPTAHAAPLKGYEALPVSITGSGKITLRPNETKTITVTYQNIGTSTWSKTGATYVSLYTYGPKYRTSVFKTTNWYKSVQPALLQEPTVKTGATGTLTFTLQAPKTPGTYQETFQAAAENLAWIPGTLFTLNITVAGDPVVIAPTSTTGETGLKPVSTTTPKPISISPSPVQTGLKPVSPSSQSPSISPSTENTPTSGIDASDILPIDISKIPSTTNPDDLKALVLLRSTKQVTAKGGEAVNYTVGIKNTGATKWHLRELRAPDLRMAGLSSQDTKHTSWLTNSRIIAKADADVLPGGLDLLNFTFTAPKTMGRYEVKYKMAVDELIVPNFEITIPVEVTADAGQTITAPLRPTEQPTTFDPNIVLLPEPTIRVGVLIVDDEVQNQVDITCESAWELRDDQTHLLAEMPQNQSINAFYKNGKYWFNRGQGLETTSYPLRFIPKTENAICTIKNFDRRISRRAANADNTFRNILELRYNSKKDRTWLINELPMEMYLRGLAETSNVSHMNFQKSLLTAARTYAFYHWERATKHYYEGFHVDAYADQVYNGYGQEARTPRLTQAVNETRGQIVRYDGKTAITPYFSRSDGRTRDWSEVWYGSVAWLKSVPTPCDQGKVLWGHGVGMSASEALCQANNGKDWQDIIRYFYQGVTIDKRW